MPNATLASLGKEVRKYRGNNSLREAAAQVGISPATLMRVEAGRVPDVETFGKICTWLGQDPGTYLGIRSRQPAAGKESTHLVMSAHFKAERAPLPDTVKALASMILFAAQRQKSTTTDVEP